jgi:hypothetical protein
VTFDPDVAVAVVIPMTVNPMGVSVRRLNVGSGNPDVAVTIPAVIASVPGPVGVLVRGRRNDFMWPFGRTDANDDLSLCNSRGEQKAAGGSEKEFLHRILLVRLGDAFCMT